MREQRELAYGAYKDRLDAYTINKKAGAKQEKLDRIINNLKRESHPTVWKEMQRQHLLGLIKKIDEDLDKLFIESPEALT